MEKRESVLAYFIKNTVAQSMHTKCTLREVDDSVSSQNVQCPSQTGIYLVNHDTQKH